MSCRYVLRVCRADIPETANASAPSADTTNPDAAQETANAASASAPSADTTNPDAAQETTNPDAAPDTTKNKKRSRRGKDAPKFREVLSLARDNTLEELQKISQQAIQRVHALPDPDEGWGAALPMWCGAGHKRGLETWGSRVYKKKKVSRARGK